MTTVTAEQLAEWKRLAEKATEGGWFIVRYGDGDSYVIHSDDERRVFFPPSPIGFSATAGSLGDSAQIKADMKFVAASRTAVPALIAEVERLRDLVYRLSDALTDEGPDWSSEGLARLRADAAHALPRVEWLQPYRAALPEESADG
jgi:hypothetical protein